MTLSLGSVSKREADKVLCVATGCGDKGFPPWGSAEVSF